jgi:hypothetical protein
VVVLQQKIDTFTQPLAQFPYSGDSRSFIGLCLSTASTYRKQSIVEEQSVSLDQQGSRALTAHPQRLTPHQSIDLEPHLACPSGFKLLITQQVLRETLGQSANNIRLVVAASCINRASIRIGNRQSQLQGKLIQQ